MNNLISLISKRDNKSSTVSLFSLLLLLTLVLFLSAIFTPTVNAADLQCKFAENIHIKPSVKAAMVDAVNKGYFYRVESGASNVSFNVNHFPFSTVEGQFNEFEGGIILPNSAMQTRQALFVIKVDSVATGDDDLNDYIKSTAFFNASQYPVIIFVSTGFEWVNESTARLVGDLTLHGKTKPLVFNVQIKTTTKDSSDSIQKMRMIASAEIQRSDFGMHELQVFVSDTVQFNLVIEASRVRS